MAKQKAAGDFVRWKVSHGRKMSSVAFGGHGRGSSQERIENAANVRSVRLRLPSVLKAVFD